MSEQRPYFKNATLGGYRKEEVNSFIAHLSEEKAGLITRLEQEVEAGKRRFMTLSGENLTLQSRVKELLEQNSKLKAQAGAMETEVAALRENLSEKQRNIDSYYKMFEQGRSELEKSRKEIERLSGELAKQTEKSAGYEKEVLASLRERALVVEMQLEARRRAQDIEASARENARTVTARLREELEAASGAYISFRDRVIEISRQTSDSLGHLRGEMDNLANTLCGVGENITRLSGDISEAERLCNRDETSVEYRDSAADAEDKN